MNRRLTPFIFFIAATLLFVLAFYIPSFQNYEKKLAQTVSSTEEKIESLNKVFHSFEKKISSNNNYFSIADSTEKLSEAPYTLLHYVNDTLVYWNNNKILPRSVRQGFDFQKYKTGYFISISHRTEKDSAHSTQLVMLIPFKYSFVTENEYLRHEYNPEFNIPDWATVSVNPGVLAQPVYATGKQILFYLSYPFPFQSNERNTAVIILWFAGIIALLLFIHFAFTLWMQSIYLWLRALLSVAVPVLFFYLLNHGSFIPAGIANWKLFAADVFASPDIGSSLGCLFIECMAGVWAVVYINFFLKTSPVSQQWLKYFSVMLFMSFVAFTGIYFVYAIKGLSRDSNLLIGFLNPIKPDYLSIIALFCLSAFAFCFFMLSQKLSEFIRAQSLSVSEKLIMLAAVAVASVLCVSQFQFDLSPFIISGGIIAAGALVYILKIKDVARFELVKLFLVLVVFSVSCAAFTTYFRQEKDVNARKALANKLISERDNVTEFLLADMRPQIESDKFVQQYFENPLLPYKEFSDRLRQLYFAFGFGRYEVDFVATDAKEHPLNVNETRNGNDFVNEIFKNAETVVSGKLFYFNTRSTGSGYAAFYPIIVNGNYLGRLYIILRSKLLNRINVYPELLLAEKDKIPEEAQSYSFAIYENNRLSESSGSMAYPVNDIYGAMISDTADFTEPLVYREKNIEHIILQQSDGDTVVISKEINLANEFFAAFSYLFVAAFFFSMLMALLFYFYFYLRGSAHRFSLAQSSFRNIIQLSYILIIFLSVIFIGLYVGKLFQEQFNANTTEKLSEKMKEVEQSVRYVVSNTVSFDSLCGFTPRDLSTILNININDFSELHDMDVNFYDMHGVLLTSSQPSIFEKGLQSRMMDANAFRTMQKQLPSEIIQQETIGTLKYQSGYKPVYNEDGQLLAYLNIPFFNSYRLLNEQIGNFFSALINILVVALLIAGFLSPYISKQMTGKLSLIAAKFKKVTVGGTNEPIEWKPRDELAVLVNEFNKMILKLDESARQLARSERESAWREMAKQVAHEIKNPLTPMKLSIQHLQRAINDGDPRAAEMTEKVSKTLIEQIDNLSKIATEFSSFAKMPLPENEKMHLLEVVYHSVNLHNGNDGVKITVETVGAVNDLVYGDKNQLLRVFNNLILNSIQAIPENAEGKIVVNARNENAHIIISVLDNGIGISDDFLQKVFVPNFTTKSSGTGLGLAITRNIIELAGGTIRFESVENSGTTFFVSLPVINA